MAEAPPESSKPPDGSDSPENAVITPGSVTVKETRAQGGRGKREPKDEGKGFLSFIRELPVLILIAFVLALLIKTFLVQAFFIPSGSMEPTLLPGDRVLVNKVGNYLGDPARGDVVVFENPDASQIPDRNWVSGFFHWLTEGLGFSQPDNEDFIKRVIALPGETVEVRDGVVYIDGVPLGEPYLEDLPEDTRAYGPERVPEGHLFVMGDNRLNSNDSRFGLGPVPIDKVVGKAFVIIWPPSRVGWIRGL